MFKLKHLFSLLFLFITVFAFAQVAVTSPPSTTNPTGTSFDIDEQGDIDVSNLLMLIRSGAGFNSRLELGNNGVINLARQGYTSTGMNISTQSIGTSTAGGHYIAFSPLQSEAMRIQNDGDVGINTSAPTDRLHVSLGSGETVRFENLPDGNGNYVVIDANGRLARCSSGTCNSTQARYQGMEDEIKVLKAELFKLQSQLGALLEETGVEEQEVALLTNMPNPFSERTTIKYQIPESLNAQNSVMYIHNFRGELVRTFQIDNSINGELEIDGTDLPTGMYVCSLIVNDQPVATRKIQLIGSRN